jgi:hypothetical protein
VSRSTAWEFATGRVWSRSGAVLSEQLESTAERLGGAPPTDGTSGEERQREEHRTHALIVSPSARLGKTTHGRMTTPVTLRRRTSGLGSTSAEVGDIIGLMAHEVHRARAPRATLGYAVVVLGAAMFVTSCFLPLQRVPATQGDRTISQYEQVTLSGGGAGSDVSGLLYLFGGVASVAAVATVALVRGGRGPVLRFLLVGAVLAWSLTWIGILWRYGTFPIFSFEYGYWLQAASIGVVVIGTILVGVGKRYAKGERTE